MRWGKFVSCSRRTRLVDGSAARDSRRQKLARPPVGRHVPESVLTPARSKITFVQFVSRTLVSDRAIFLNDAINSSLLFALKLLAGPLAQELIADFATASVTSNATVNTSIFRAFA